MPKKSTTSKVIVRHPKGNMEPDTRKGHGFLAWDNSEEGRPTRVEAVSWNLHFVEDLYIQDVERASAIH